MSCNMMATSPGAKQNAGICTEAAAATNEALTLGCELVTVRKF